MTKQRMHATAARLCLCALLAATPVPPALSIDTQLPDLGNSAGGLMTPKRERELGQAFMRSVRHTQKVMDDPLLTDYIQSLGRRLADSNELRGTPFSFFLIDDPRVNAFAGPGGHIGIYTGLLLTTETESELAAVLAHEMAHVTQQHLLRAWESTSQLSIPSAAVLLAAVVLGATVGGDAAAAAALGGQAALIQQQINFTRANEKEADRVGIELLADAGFEPRAMPSFFSRMGQANRVYASKLPEFLMTHPVTTSRTADALGRAEQFPYRQNPDELRYHLVRMHLLQRQIERPQDAIRELTLMLEDGRFRSEPAVRYGIALARIRAKQYEQAAKEIDRLLKDHPQNMEFAVTLAQIDAQTGGYDRALQRLIGALAEHPTSLALTVVYAETALAAGDAIRASERLQRYLEFEAGEPRIYQLLARAAAAQQKPAAGHQYLSEYHYLTGDLENAVLQLEIALKTPGLNFYELSKLESKLAELKAEVRDADTERSPRR